MLPHNPMSSSVKGQLTTSEMPDTLDLSDRMSLAINALTNVWFPEHSWALGFNVDFFTDPAQLRINHVTDAFLNTPPQIHRSAGAVSPGLRQRSQHRS